PKASGKLVIVGRDHAAFARSDELIGIKTERRAVAMPTDALAFIAGPHSFGSVLNYEQSMPLRKLENRVEIHRVAIKMDRHNASGPWRDLGCHFARIHVEGIQVIVDKDWGCATVAYSISACDVGQAWNDNLIARLQSERDERKMEGGCTVIGCNGVLNSTELGEFALEFRDKSAYRGDPTRRETFENILGFAAIEERCGHRNAWRGCQVVPCSLISRGHYGCSGAAINPADQAAHDRLKRIPAPMLRRYVPQHSSL